MFNFNIGGIMDEIKKTSKSLKILSLVVLICAATCGGLLTSCGIITPTGEYVLHNDQRADLHFPRYKMLIEDADKKMLEKITGKAPGTYDSLTEEQVQNLIKTLLREVDAWRSNIKANANLVNKKDIKEN